MWKTYDFPLPHSAARTIAFSSYPGIAGSTDDYYMMSSGLAVTETTLSMLTDEPYDKLDDSSHNTIPDFLRIMVANRLARSGPDWVRSMQRSWTGTYSSQWLVLDTKELETARRSWKGVVGDHAAGTPAGPRTPARGLFFVLDWSHGTGLIIM